MKRTKAFIAALLMCTSVFYATGCSEAKNDSQKNGFDKKKTKQLLEASESSGLLTGELENKKIKWLSDWDINADPHADLALFQEIYGGEIEYVMCTYEDRYEKLARCISSGEGIDFFYAGNRDSFPKCALNDLFAPYDDYIDLDSELWKDVKAVNDGFTMNDSHYVAITQTKGDDVAVLYNKKTIEEAGLTDPAKLYAEGKWTWNEFREMLESFVDTKNNKYGIDGWWFEFGLINTIGIPPVSYENSRIVNNIGTSEMAGVQNFMYELYQKDLIAIGVGDYGWEAKPQYIGEGKLLFYPVGLYELYKPKSEWEQLYGEDVSFVPMPKDPNAKEHCISTGIEAYALVSGGQNPEGVARYLDCKRFCIVNDTAKEIGESIFADDYGWSEDMEKMREEMQRLSDANPVIDVSMGVSSDCGEILNESLRLTARGVDWSETYDSIAPVVEEYINEVNKGLDK